jgi:CheY-like chemotaxis protein
VDDSGVIRKILSKHLVSLSVVHQLCVDGCNAWTWLKENSTNCCGVITDLEMPKMGGLELIGHVHDHFPDIPCFIASGNEILPIDLPPGARWAILKPILVEDVTKILLEIRKLQHLPGSRRTSGQSSTKKLLVT